MDNEHEMRRAGGAGLLAALVMLAVQLIWRTQSSSDGVVQAFPEFIATAIAKLTPISMFGTITETYGSNAKKTLLVACCVGVVVVGILAGRLAWRLTASHAPSFGRRLAAGAGVALLLFLVVTILILPITDLGVFARHSSHTSDILTQLIITFALFAVVWAMLTGTTAPESDASAATVDRRSVITSGAWLVLALASIGGIIAALTSMLRAKPISSEELAQQEAAANQIIADQRATETAGTPSASGTPVIGPEVFAQLEADGKLTPVLTTTVDFYHVSKNFTDPTVSADGWTLSIEGLVDTPVQFTLEDLNAMATTRMITTLCCISNEINGDLIGTAEWQAVPLVDLLAKAGVQAGTVDFKLSAADDYHDSFPLAVGQDPNVLVVVGMNGAPLGDDHGYPARLIVPPIYGMKNVKWITKIEAVNEDYIGFWQERGWSDDAHYQIWGRIDYPTGKIKAGQDYVCGVASAGDRGINRVEISLDGGDSWLDATLEPPLNGRFTWVRWAMPFTAQIGEYDIKMRATDGTGTVMTQKKQPPAPDGATGWPSRDVKVN